MRRLGVIALLALASCNNIASPALVEIYDYRDIRANAHGQLDTLMFHWPRSLLPVRIWVPDTSALKPYVSVAIQRWQDVFLYGEYQAVMVADSAQADVILLGTLPHFVRGAEYHHAFAAQCSGQTDAPDIDTHLYALPIHSYVYALAAGATVPGLATCFSITVTHEIGHSLGLLAHSPNPSDVMYSNPIFDGISERDRETANTAYHVPSNVTVVGRR
jgi:predicted Zn-dependent protease